MTIGAGQRLAGKHITGVPIQHDLDYIVIGRSGVI
jgi:hypothetical protein